MKEHSQRVQAELLEMHLVRVAPQLEPQDGLGVRRETGLGGRGGGCPRKLASASSTGHRVTG